MSHCKYPRYPRGWHKVSRTIRRIAGGCCERCGCHSDNLSVHHQGAPYPDGRPGDPGDKHDIRRENLLALCHACHDELEPMEKIRARRQLRNEKRQARIAQHRALGVGTGLVPVSER